MATSIFKQQCPACDAMVPIKDRSLVGKKIDCPKCKKRFVVEDPDAGAAEDEKEKKDGAAKDKGSDKGGKEKPKKKSVTDDYEQDEEGLGRPKRKPKKGEGGKSKMMVGIGLAGFAVILLGVAGFFMLSPSENSAKNPVPSSGNNPGGTAGGPTSQAPPPGEAAPPQQEAAKKSQPTATSIAADVTTLLPADTELVFHVVVKDILRSSMGKSTTDLSSLLDQKQGWLKEAGLAPEDVERIVIADSLSKNSGMVIVRTSKPLKFDIIKKQFELKSADAPIRGQDYFTVKPYDLLKQNPQFSKQELTMLNLSMGQKTVGVRLHDDQTLLVADLDALKQFLEGSGKPAAAEKPKEGEGAAEAGGKGDRDPAMRAPGMAMAPGGPPGMAGAPGAPGAQGGAAAPTTGVPSSSYQTINPRLKAMLDKMEAKPFLLSMAYDCETKQGAGISSSVTGLLGGVLSAPNMRFSTLGFAVQAEGGLGCIAGVECKDVNTMNFVENMVLAGMYPAIDWLKDRINFMVDWQMPQMAAGQVPGAPAGAMPGFPGAGLEGGPGIGRGNFPGNRGMMPGAPGMPPPGMGAANPMNPLAGGIPITEEEKPNGKVTVNGPDLIDRTLIMTAKLDTEGLNYLYDEFVQEGLLLVKGGLEMNLKHAQPHELALAVKQFADRSQFFPRGAYDRPIAAGRTIRPWLPDQRVSWMAEMLPYLGYGDVHVAFDKSWRDADNRRAAMTVVPFFLYPGSKPETWRIYATGHHKHVAATHFVGVAGVGRDAGDFSEKDTTTDKKRGIFGYDRRTPLTELVDSASMTIAVIGIPPETRGPWLAGGGSTVRGVPETNSIQPFVSTTHNGQKGTVAMFADGSVRFISDKISDRVFQSLCVVDKNKAGTLDETTLMPAQQHDLKPQAALPKNTVAKADEAKPPEAKPAEAAVPPAAEFTSAAGGFSVSMNGKPAESKQNLQTLAGPLAATVYETEGTASGSGQAVVFLDISPAVIQAGSPQQVIDGGVDGLVANKSGNLIEQKPVTVNGQPGKEGLIQTAKGFIRFRVFLVGNRLFQVMAAGTKEQVNSKDTDKFFDSFKTTK